MLKPHISILGHRCYLLDGMLICGAKWKRKDRPTARWREPNPPVPKYFWAGVWFSNHPVKRCLEGPNICSKSVWKLLEDYGNERMLFVIYICLKFLKLGSMFSLNDLSMHTVKLPTLSWDMLCISQKNHSQASDGCWNVSFTWWMLQHVEVWFFFGGGGWKSRPERKYEPPHNRILQGGGDSRNPRFS